MALTVDSEIPEDVLDVVARSIEARRVRSVNLPS